MSDETLNVARFERVDQRGDLVFSCEGKTFIVRVDDRLEQGILASKQIREENEGSPNPQESLTIPISTIQSMVRAGFTTEKIAQGYTISEALVRRFAKPVEVEKKYAIEQFLSAPAPGTLRHQSVSNVIAASLHAVQVPINAVKWQATRQGRDPWRIHATFEALGRTIKAEWSWDMRDNSVTPINTTAGRLLRISRFEIQDRSDPDPLGGDLFAAVPSTPTAARHSTPAVSAPAPPTPSAPPTETSSPAAEDAPATDGSGADTGKDEPRHAAAVEDAATAATNAWLYGSEPHAHDKGGNQTSDGTTAKSDDTAKPKRRNHRSAVPSWEEILFGGE